VGSPFSKASFRKMTLPGEKGFEVDTPTTAVTLGFNIVLRPVIALPRSSRFEV
jgi:hypothetical protein